MPADSLIVSICVIAMFVVFGAVRIWDDRQPRPSRLTGHSATKRRAF
jgi:hypothetical protein